MESLIFTHYDLTNGDALEDRFERNKSRTGVYVLHFTDGTQYVGKANDVLARFRQHLDYWREPILCVEFAPVADLEEVFLHERLTIQRRLAQGHTLRNDQHTKESAARAGMSPVVDLDTAEAIERALLTPVEDADQIPYWIPQPGGATPRGYTPKLLAASYADDVIDVLAYCVRYVLPNPAVTEGRYWKVKAPMAQAHDGATNVATLIVQNVPFVHVRVERTGRITVEVHLDPHPVVSPHYGFENIPFPYMLKGSLIQRGHLSPEILIDALTDDPVFLEATRRTTHRLQRRGQSTNRHIHDPALADIVFGRITRLGLTP
ncbi:GIY-YIG nuclease family protein [Kocuria sp. UCD-OTCP]|uniref:GIY-YIG nuclease family protein n=1 Tax=Kocuria sp. UCD-OTCP TaxID=1292021 RepID=UPI000372F18F|nr:GIY-YIG nuclease family protein [Kocuria sp. UCD-OTCP]EYT53322.1 hypothetical protein H488_0107450 [Kocuria sp. UCD-OTCP]